MSWTLLVSCNSFKLKINPENDHAIGDARLQITNTWNCQTVPSSLAPGQATQRRNLADGPSADNLGLLPGWNVPKVATSFGHRPQMWLGRLGEQHGTTSCNLKSPYVSVFLCPGKMDDSIRHLTPVSWMKLWDRTSCVPNKTHGSSENSEVSWIIWIHLASLLSVTSFTASVTSVAAKLLSGQDERSDAKRRRSDAKRRGWGREGSKDNAVIMRAAARRSALGLGAGRFPGIHIVWFYELEKIDGFSLKDRVFQDFPVYHLAPYQILDIA